MLDDGLGLSEPSMWPNLLFFFFFSFFGRVKNEKGIIITLKTATYAQHHAKQA